MQKNQKNLMVGNMRTFETDRQTDRRTYRLTEVVSWLPRDSKKILVQERMHIQVAQLIGKWGDFKSSGEDAKNVSNDIFVSATSQKSIQRSWEKFGKILENWVIYVQKWRFWRIDKKFASAFQKIVHFVGVNPPPPAQLLRLSSRSLKYFTLYF